MFTRRTFHVVFVLFLAMVLIMAGCCLLPPPSTYTINATAGAGGSITPSGAISITEGANQTFTITPDTGYQVSDVLIDGISVGAVPAYTFTNVQQNHTISASFAQSVTPIAPVIIRYTITASAGTGGSIDPEGTIKVKKGNAKTFIITPDEGYVIADVLVDGTSIGAVSVYSFTNVRQHHTIDASFTQLPISYLVTFSIKAGEGIISATDDGNVITSGAAVKEGSLVEFTASPDTDYRLEEWYIDNLPISSTSTTYIIGDLETNVDVQVAFEIIAYTAEECFTFESFTGIITDYDPSCGGSNVVIPPTIGGIPVEHIGNDAFQSKGLTSITITDSVTTIGENAFAINQLTSLTLGSSVTTIGAFAFANTQLTSVIIPNSVTYIGYAAFLHNQLASVTIPDSVTNIGYGAFYDNQLTSVTISNSLTYIDDNTFSNNQLTSVIIPDSVTTIGNYAFSSNQLISLTLGSSVTTIGGYAFTNNQLTSVTIPDSVTGISIGAFSSSPLTSITIGSGVYIYDDVATMGINPGFRELYDAGGKLAGTYNYNGIEWSKA